MKGKLEMVSAGGVTVGLIAMDDGTEVEVGPGDLCAIPPGHDAWLLGDEPYVSLHFRGTEEYAGH